MKIIFSERMRRFVLLARANNLSENTIRKILVEICKQEIKNAMR